MWKGMNGFLTYYACLMGVDPTLYEAAVIDGASRWQQRKYVSLSSLVPLICLYLIYAVADIFGGDFGLFYTIPRNVGLMQSVIGCLLLVGTNAIVRKVSPENSLF